MTTNAVLATQALKRLRLVGTGQNPAAADLQDAIDALESMHGSWTADGLVVPSLPLNTRFDQGVVAMLAVRLSGDYGKPIDEVLARDARRGERQIRGAFFAVPASRFDDAVKNTGHQYGDGIILGETDDNYGSWQASAAYRLREFVTNAANLYECTTAGTSAASGGPTGTDNAITDGTVTWSWRRIVGEPPQE
jgi:hypothetical protein